MTERQAAPEQAVQRQAMQQQAVQQQAAPAAEAFRQERYQPPAGALDLLLVRHGQSEAYLDGQPFALVGGQGDPPLSALGHKQARLVCARLADQAIEAIYATPLQRTAQTAAPLAERLGLSIGVEPDLREVFLGEWEGGLFRKMVATGHPIALQMAAEERWDAIPGAESAEALAARVRVAILKIAAAHPGQRVAVFTHGGIIGQAMALASRSRPFAFSGAENTSISRLVITADRWIVRGYNDTSHLDGAGGC
ncbi:MAG TPA: histidine phosphatase family protein [Streptosporangiaceae bacterium]